LDALTDVEGVTEGAIGVGVTVGDDVGVTVPPNWLNVLCTLQKTMKSVSIDRMSTIVREKTC
jgi:hypothetical protein